jgi:chromosome segregation ATPase
MATQAKVTSVEALEVFRASLIVFLNKAHSSVDQVSDEIRRVRSWVQHDQRSHWENEVRRRQRELAQAEQEMLSARMTKALDNLSTQQQAVNKARRSLEEALEKMRRIKLWIRDFDGTIEPLAKGLNSLRGYLDHDMPQAIAYLNEIEKIMEGYMDVRKGKLAGEAKPAGETTAPAEEPQPEKAV